MTELAYVFVVPLAWVISGCTKLAVLFVRERRLRLSPHGLGGLPSTHLSVAAAPMWLALLNGSASHPLFPVCVAMVMIVGIDAVDTRRQIGRIAAAIKDALPGHPEIEALRSSIGHTPLEAVAGIFVGLFAAILATLWTAIQW